MAAIHDVFISHAGEDKDSLAQPIYEYLRKLGIHGFLDREELGVGGNAPEDMIRAMETAPIGLFILSPEFVMKKWTMKELFCFDRRRAQAAGASGEGANVVPVLIPVFYRLGVRECRYEKLFDKYRELAARHWFFHRALGGDADADIKKVMDALAKLTEYTGVENFNDVTNDATEEMEKRQEELVKQICKEVGETMTKLFPVRCNVPENSGEVTLDFEGSESGAGGSHQSKLLQEITREDEGNERRIIGVKGGAGVGKSCLLRGVGRRDEIRFRFRGGVYYLSLGMDATMKTMMGELLTMLQACGKGKEAEELRNERRLETVLERVREAFKGKKCLILVDDLWQRDELGPQTVDQVCQVLGEDSGGVVVVTTRDTAVAVKGRVVEIAPRGVLSAESKRMFLRHAKLSIEEIAEECSGIFEELVKLCGGLPLCLAVMGRGFREMITDTECMGLEVWDRYLKMMREREKLVFGEVDGYKNVWKTLSVALRVLEECQGRYEGSGIGLSWTQMYRSLCTMKKQSVVSFGVLARMWVLESENEASHVVKSFSGVGLADVVIGGEERTSGIRLHDLNHDFCVACAKKENEVSQWHKRILEGYIREEERVNGLREWWKVEDDGYIYENVCRHLWQSANLEELIELLLNRGWTEGRFDRGGFLSWIRDFGECEEGISASTRYEGEKEAELKKGLKLVRDGVVESWTFVKDNRWELGFQVEGRLEECREEVVQKFLGSVREGEEKPHAKPLGRWWGRPGRGGRGGEFAFRNYVWDIALLNERRMAVAGVGRDVVIIDMEGMQVARACTGHARYVRSVGFRSDGDRVLSWSRDGVVREWDVESGEEVRCVTLKRDGESEDRASEFYCASFCPQSNVVATGSRGGRVEVWDIGSGERRGEATGEFDGGVQCVSVSRDGRRIVAGGVDGTVRLWDATTGAQVRYVLKAHKYYVNCVAFSADGQLVASGSDDGTIRVWEVESGAQRGDPIRGHERRVLCVSFSEDGLRLVSGGADKTVISWDAVTGAQIGRSLRGHVDSVRCLSITGDKQFVVSGGADQTVRVWDLATVSDDAEERLEDAIYVNCLDVSTDGRLFVSGAWDGTVRIYDGRNGRQVGDTLHAHDWGVSCVAVSPCGHLFVSGSWDNTLCVWDVQTRAQVGEPLQGHTELVRCATYSPNGRFIISGSDDKTVRVWSTVTHVQIGAPIGGGAEAAVDRMPPRKRRRQFGYCNERAIYGEETRGELLNMHTAPVSCIRLSADGGRIVCGLEDGSLFVWDMSSRKLVGTQRFAHKSIIGRLDLLARNLIRSVDYGGAEMSWRLDDEKGLVEWTRAINSGKEGSEGDLSEGSSGKNELLCVGRDVRVRGSDVKLATLPAHALPPNWRFSEVSGVLGVVLVDKRLLFLQVEH